jgi:hypothetical protein
VRAAGSRWTRRRPGLARLSASTLATLACGLGFALLPGLASAKVTTVEGTKVGLQVRDGEHFVDGYIKLNSLVKEEANPVVSSMANESGHAVMHKAGIYAIYWDPQDYYHGDWQELVDNFLSNVGLEGGQWSNIFSVLPGYTDATQHATGKPAYLGSYVDTNPYPELVCENPRPFELLLETFETAPSPNCLTDSQIREELSTFIAQHGLPHGMGTIYDVLTPPGVSVCLGNGGPTGHCSEYAEGSAESLEHSFCSYHSWIGPSEPEGTIYDVIPWTAGGLADGHLAEKDAKGESRCQDGGWNTEGGFSHETVPAMQEPNQLKNMVGPDGFYDHALPDSVINQIAVEAQNTITDPLLNAWQDSEANEVTDECRNDFYPKLKGSYAKQPGTFAGTLSTQEINGGLYYLQTAYNLAAMKLPFPQVPCVPGIRLEPIFALPTSANSGEVVGFNGMDSVVSLDWSGLSLSGPGQTYATYTWNFGDGSAPVTGYAPGSPLCTAPWLSPCAGSAFHTYAYGGVYPVTLTITDAGGHQAFTKHEIFVNGPAKPSSGGGSEGGGGGGGGAGGTAGGHTSGGPSGGGAGGGSGGTTSSVLPAPTAAAAPASGSLRTALRKGLTIRYSVNEQVAGTIDVLLDSATARRLHLRAPAAVGLPAGYPPSVVIGHAVLVTRTGGSGAVRLKLSKSAQRALRRVHKVTLTLRLVVRNASRTNPTSTSLISSFVLHH